jgi:peptidoglycan/xylan/chitin deacetylase (PgdA/CDA1 family)
MYHAFGTGRERASRYVIPARRFRAQMWWLRKRRYNVLSLEEYAAHRREHRFPPAKSVVITIDDGYLDTDTVARPILQQLGFPATLFLITSRPREGAHGDSGLDERPVIDLARAGALPGHAIRLGAHTRTHPDLADIDGTALKDEIQGSKDDLEQALGKPVTTFAYPYGSVTPAAREVVRAAGFSVACGVQPGRNRPVTDPFDLRRIEIRGTYGLLRFAAALLLGGPIAPDGLRVRR